jgi:hypothetical protein
MEPLKQGEFDVLLLATIAWDTVSNYSYAGVKKP